MMYEYYYTLQKQHLVESHEFLALHDRTLQNKMISLIFSLLVLCIVLALWFFKLTMIGFLVSAILALMVILLFPSIYWKVVFDRISNRIEHTRLEFHEIHLQAEDSLIITEQNNTIMIQYTNIQHIECVKSDLLIFYKNQGKRDTLIIPIDVIKQDLEDFLLFIEKEVSNGQTGII